MINLKTKFDKYIWSKNYPSSYEQELFSKTQKYCRYISWIPGLKMVAVCNSLSMYATKDPSSPWAKSNGSINYPHLKDSSATLRSAQNDEYGGGDIDLFIVTAKNRLWLVRVMVTLVFQLLGVRRHWNNIAERFCLSFFIDETAMNFSSFAIKNDVYLYFWIYYLKPIINKDLTYENFIKANKPLGIDPINLHKDNRIYEIQTWKQTLSFPLPLSFPRRWESIKIISSILDFKNYLLKKIFLPRTLAHKKRLWNPEGLIVEENILKFHDNDRRVEVRDGVLGS
ncbi:MAG: hypothetical protein ACD_49C00079G0025 [uncultured bacterium (gcode 4)]|uniref:Uncharacterized protein n=1 Tax=uncultured bacterium (gcode 4) TaxID=1234023 RepID=K2AVZ6_9BACT|nr:MAG: hypothetical protein ACD_49C00079G0025 [uncultured bacterium (gcode 4)]